MQRMILMAMTVMIFAGAGISRAQEVPASATAAIKTADVNKDGKADVTYFNDGTNVTKAEADTNFDGVPDIVVYVNNGQFASAEIDTDYNGSTDKKITDADQFKQWVNANRPAFNQTLVQPAWQIDRMNF